MYNTVEPKVFIIQSAEHRRRRIEYAKQHLRRQNELAPISRIPPEILAVIFVRCVPTLIDTLRSDLSWLNVTRVSSQWRKVALACPDFWSTPIFSRPKWTPVMLARSKMASLVVRVDLAEDQANSLEPILLENASRLGALDIRSPQHQLTMFLTNLEQADAACRLQDIKVVNTDADSLGIWLAANLFRRTQVLESRKMGTHPGVRLHLQRCAFRWESGWYSHLTRLHLEDIGSSQSPAMEVFLTILLGSPNLEILTLIHCSPTDPGRGFPVQLPRLTALTIRNNFISGCLPLLEYLAIPPSATIDATVSYPVEAARAHELLTIFLKDPSPKTYDTVHMVKTPYTFTYSLPHSARPEWCRKLRIAASWPYLHTIEILKTISNHLDFSNVTTLHLQAPSKLDSPDEGNVAFGSTLSLWDTLGRALPHLHTLHLYESFPALWLQLFLTQAMLLVGVSHYRSCFNLPMLPEAPHGLALPFRDPDGMLTHGWPSLHCIALHKIDLHDPVNDYSPACADVLVALLWARCQGEVPICRLEIDKCTNVSRRDLAYFLLLADVVYDGKGRTDDKVGHLESLRSYSIGVFAKMIELSRQTQQ
ncbi:hypothetical protein DFH08DRAFT_303401 [Mycena albidolilacea]|uniref:F-box domain-containing protein n=1 Tax=Mycena albidolilacea TaxID=1033008 RepID=A0AAD6ZQD7_9AGAR|nr:hypothetical protein DFH08DRAFT_303401 [Mycena albidolilacea]